MSLPEVVPTIPLRVPFAAPPKVRLKPAPAIVPVALRVILPVPAITELAAARVGWPAKVAAVTLLLKMDPPLEMPVPLMTIASAVE